MASTNINNYTVGKGRIYFDPLDASGKLTGERYFGNTPSFSFKQEIEKKEHTSDDEGIEQIDYSIITKAKRSGELETDAMTSDNVALFIMGDVSLVSQAAGNVTDEPLTVAGGLYYQLGRAANVSGVRNINTVIVKADAANGPTYKDGDDYRVEAALGRLFIQPGGAIDKAARADPAKTHKIKVSYTTTAATREQLAPTNRTAIFGALRVVADNPAGDNRDWYFPRVSLTPSGDFKLKGKDWQSIKFNVDIQQVPGQAAFYIDGRPA